jgi:hypothetical protein
VSWSASDDAGGSGLATDGTYDVQYRKSTSTYWRDWLVATIQTSEVFSGEEGITYHFRVRARDAVLNEGAFSGLDEDATTTVDTIPPELTVLTPLAGQILIEGQLELKVHALDSLTSLETGDVEVSLDGLEWSILPLQSRVNDEFGDVLDTANLSDADYLLWFRATDAAGHMTKVSVNIVVDNTDPTCAIVAPSRNDMVFDLSLIQVEAWDLLGIDSVLVTLSGIPGLSDEEASYNDATGYWEFLIDPMVEAEGQATVSARATDASGRDSQVLEAIPFWFDNQGPQITIITPNPGDWQFNDTAQVRVGIVDLNFDPDKDDVEINISEGDWTEMSSQDGEFSHQWDIRSLADGEYGVHIRTQDTVGHLSETSIVVFVDVNSPALSLVSPTPGLTVTGEVVLAVTAEDVFLEETKFNIDGEYWISFEENSTTLDTTLFPSGERNITIMVVDAVGHETELTFNVFFDHDPPSVNIISPRGDVGGEVRFKIEVVDASEIEEVQIRIGDGEWITAEQSKSGHYVYLWKTGPSDEQKGLEIRVRAVDVLGNENEHSNTINIVSPEESSTGTIWIVVAIAIIASVVGFLLYRRRSSQ